ncbi:16S rRNA (uracil(1498)-N(3))-methyltransferase [Anaerolineales bacterium HSG6]|nr:16S rRNA (uracil(1498)-N(3))-methyltransferase [Anaerolineales bacterium HSG6]
MSHHFFIPPNWIAPPEVTLFDNVARQIKTVLRMQEGEQITVLDGSGRSWQVELTQVSQNSVHGRILSMQTLPSESTIAVTLYQGTLKGQKFEWVLQKGTELGVSRFVPLISERSVVTDITKLVKKNSRWQRIIQEAAEQSKRARLPVLAPPQPFTEAIAARDPVTLTIFPWEESRDVSLKQLLGTVNYKPTRISVFIGPEGGFSQIEAEQATQHGLNLVTLGSRILRAETAAIATCAAIFYEYE